jgi:anti-sigma regulatory factor (Ser/Thr protein kinase)
VSETVGLIPDSIEVVALEANISELSEWTEGWAKAHALDSDAVFAMRLCVEEAATNIAHYAYEPMERSGTIAIAASDLGAAGVRVTITDHGRPFDVAAARDPGVEHDIQSATVGGRGIRLMRRFSETLQYARVGGRNQLTMTFATNRFPRER